MSKENYFDKVFELTRKIPFGKVTTYGTIANHLALGSARMVGWALNKSHTATTSVPAHRVVNRKGELSGRNYFTNPNMMQEMLEQEGIEIKDNKVINLNKHLWTPSNSD